MPAIFVIALIIGAGYDSKKEPFLTTSMFSTEGKDLCYHVPMEIEIASTFDGDSQENLIFLGKSYIGFKEALAFKESRGRYQIVNAHGYLGKYQFSKATLRMIGFKDIDNFLENSQQQEAAFNAYVAFNKWVLRKEIERYANKTIGGVKVTESGLLAAAHLAGPGNVKKYLKSNGVINSSDANGATVGYYLKMFSGYDTSHIKAAKKPQHF